MKKHLYDLCVGVYLQLKTKRLEYLNLTTFTWYSERYKKYITVQALFSSDGATGGIDILSRAWLVHDHVCVYWVWDDGTPITVWQSGMILHDALKEEGRTVRANGWGSATYVWQLLKRPFRKGKGK